MPGTVFYQVDFSAVASGKRVATTKRKIRWYVASASGIVSLLICCYNIDGQTYSRRSLMDSFSHNHF